MALLNAGLTIGGTTPCCLLRWRPATLFCLSACAQIHTINPKEISKIDAKGAKISHQLEHFLPYIDTWKTPYDEAKYRKLLEKAWAPPPPPEAKPAQ